jgi:hypothetical protein
LGVTLDNASVGRVLGYIGSKIVRKERQVEGLNGRWIALPMRSIALG